MIIVKLMGGLGNQMFQYAAGRRLAHSLGVDLKLDISGFEKDPLRNYALGALNIVEHFASTEEVLSLTSEKRNVITRLARRLLPSSFITPATHIKERHRNFDQRILSLPDNIYLDGYWQSEKYFLDVADIIRKEFTVKFQQTGKDFELAKEIASCESVSIHVRRGDYVSSPSANRILGVLDSDYYKRATEQLSEMLKEPQFIVFSDEPQLVRDYLKLPFPIKVVVHNGQEKCYEDMRLMCQCRHHIIGNSSFSWWGAWINPRKDKRVFAPKYWRVDKSDETTDLIPKLWTRI